jgi:putative membrane protein
MIIGTRPRIQQIAIEISKPLAVLFAWDVIVTAFHFYSAVKEPAVPMPLFGTALGLFLGFRTNAAYARWWEARTLWGALINSSRSLARVSKSFLLGQPEASEIILRQVAFAHAMRCRLRGQDANDEITRLAGPEVAKFAAGRTNGPNALAEDISIRISQVMGEGKIDTRQQAVFERILMDVANAQGGMERIKNTPLPNGFRFLPDLFTRLFCVVLPIALVETLGIYTPLGSTLVGMIFLAALRIGDDLTDPFANSVHDVPMTAMCATIETDLLEMIDLPGPPPVKPEHGVLW